MLLVCTIVILFASYVIIYWSYNIPTTLMSFCRTSAELYDIACFGTPWWVRTGGAEQTLINMATKNPNKKRVLCLSSDEEGDTS